MEKQKVTVYTDLRKAIAYIIDQELNELDIEADLETASLLAAELVHNHEKGIKVQLDPHDVARTLGTHFDIVFERKTVLAELVRYVALNGPGFQEKDPYKMVELVSKYIDYPIEKIAHRIALQLQRVQDPQKRKFRSMGMAGNPDLEEARVELPNPRTTESFKEEATRFRFCIEHLIDIEKRSVPWRNAVFTKFQDLVDAHFDYGNSEAITIDEVIDALGEIRDIYAHTSDFDRDVVSIVDSCSNPVDKKLITSLLQPLDIKGLEKIQLELPGQ